MKTYIIIIGLILGFLLGSIVETYAQSGEEKPSVVKAQAFSRSYGTDTAYVSRFTNTNTNGESGFIAVVGNDTMYLLLSNDSIRLFGTKPMNLLKKSDSTDIFITPYDTILLSSRIGLLEALNLLNDSDYIHSTGNDTIWGTLSLPNFDFTSDPAISSKSYTFDLWDKDGGTLAQFNNSVLSTYSWIRNAVRMDTIAIIDASDTDTTLMYNDGENFVIDSDNPATLNNELKLVNPSANYISSLTALDITTSSGYSIASIDSTQTQFYENVFFEKTISTDSTIIITDASGADSTTFRDNGTNLIIDNDNPIKITNIPVDASPDSMLTTTNGVIGKVAMVDLNDITVNVISADTLIMGNDTIIDIVVNLVDDGYYDLPASTTIKGELFVEGGTSRANFFVITDATVALDYYTDVVTTDTDNKFCIFDNTTSARIRNRLGTAKMVHIIYRF